VILGRNILVKKALFCLALALAGFQVARAGIVVSPMTQILHPNPAVDGFDHYAVASAYPLAANNFTTDTQDTVRCDGQTSPLFPNWLWDGSPQRGHAENVRAVPGVLALTATDVDGLPQLDVNAFVSCPEGTHPDNKFVQSYRLFKNVPASGKCPITFGAREYIQFGSQIRTWWSLFYTNPGTTFTLEAVVRCVSTGGAVPAGAPVLHKEIWNWEVTANFNTLRATLDLMHAHPLGTTEIPCIAAEDIYLVLQSLVGEIEAARDTMP
jgi:hypothetical protein